jgi:hypothetical protein
MLPMLRLVLDASLRFDPMIVYITLGVCGVLLLCRVLLGWAMRD